MLLRRGGVSLSVSCSLILATLLFSPAWTKNDVVEKVSDNEFLNLIQTEKHVVTIFSKS